MCEEVAAKVFDLLYDSEIPTRFSALFNLHFVHFLSCWVFLCMHSSCSCSSCCSALLPRSNVYSEEKKKTTFTQVREEEKERFQCVSRKFQFMNVARGSCKDGKERHFLLIPLIELVRFPFFFLKKKKQLMMTRKEESQSEMFTQNSRCLMHLFSCKMCYNLQVREERIFFFFACFTCPRVYRCVSKMQLMRIMTM